MWDYTQKTISTNSIKYLLSKEGKTLTFSQVIEYWQNDNAFINFFNQLLNDTPFEAYLWETPPLNYGNLDRLFEFILIESKALTKVGPDLKTYQSYFNRDEIVVFPNIRKDAVLIVPSPANSLSNYAHLANFVRSAPRISNFIFLEKSW